MGAITPPNGPANEGERRSTSLASLFAELFGRDQDPECLLRWPPDLFVLTSRALGVSDAYRSLVSPPQGVVVENPGRRAERTARAARIWLDYLDAERGEPWLSLRSIGDYRAGLDDPLPESELSGCWSSLRSFWDGDLESLCAEGLASCDQASARALSDLVDLHAIADGVCARLTSPSTGRSDGGSGDEFSPFADAALALLGVQNSLATVHRGRGCVLPKTHTSQVGLTIRSLSHHLAYHRYATKVEWWRPWDVEPSQASWGSSTSSTFSVLLFPWPRQVHARMFSPLDTNLPLADGYGYFHYNPRPVDDDQLRPALRDVIESARQELARGDPLDLLVLPETAVGASDWDYVRSALVSEDPGFRSYIVGVREPGDTATAGLGENRAEIGIVRSPSDGRPAKIDRRDQHKHHRWRLDRGQIQGYSLTERLDPNVLWWEGIRVPERKVTFVEPVPGVTVCPLICEDLARQDPVASMLRAVGPSLVICLLMDGPQIAHRWSANYATVLADDPGCSVLTLTSKGMVDRWSSPYFPPRDVVALWRQPSGVTRELDLCGADALLLRVRRESGVLEWTIDGRRAERQRLVLDGVTRIRTR